MLVKHRMLTNNSILFDRIIHMNYISYLIKPASSLCNLRCKYCFYEDEVNNRDIASYGVMKEETVDNIINNAYSYLSNGGYVSFAFQGGEPTVATLPFFKSFVKKAKERKPNNISIRFSIQTNGTLIDEEWAEFLSKEGFLVGLSIDGYKSNHDKYRLDASSNPTYDKVLETKKLFDKYNVQYNALCVVTKDIAYAPKKAYNTLKNLGFRYIQFIACLDFISLRGKLPWSLTPEAYGNFLCQVFDLYFNDYMKGDYHSIRLFDDYIHTLLKDNQSTCATCGKCGAYVVVEGDGSIYPCDFFCLDSYKIGNINELSIEEIYKSQKINEFLEFGKEKPSDCKACPYSYICNGGCKNDWAKKDDRYYNYYCKSFKMLFSYALERMKYIASNEMKARRGY